MIQYLENHLIFLYLVATLIKNELKYYFFLFFFCFILFYFLETFYLTSCEIELGNLGYVW